MALFAEISDYEARYGKPVDAGKVEVLLADASDALLSAYEAHYGEAYAEGEHDAFDRSACAVACLMANRVVAAPSALMGATQYSQGAGGYTASVTLGSAVGEMYLGKSDLKRLGLTDQRIRSVRPDERGEL